ncbi:MAG: hypothetical protein JXA71_02120 [Chitinispirillaceae bacterium]|nr:hypothetical protein [Chitinispirillaceae bacterium]
MKKFLLITFLSVFAQTTFADLPSKLTVHFFGSSTCGECAEIKTTLLKPLASKYQDKLDVRLYDTDTDSGFHLAIKLEELHGVKASSPQELFLSDTFLLGYEAILKHGRAMIEEYLAHPEKWVSREVVVDKEKFVETLKERFQKFTFLQIVLAGLVDGVNPCAIATMIFLISFLAVQKRKKGEILAIGMTFSAAVFITYLLLGIGAFKALSLLQSYHWIATGLRWFAVVFALAVAALCFRDAIVFAATGKVKDIKLQLPAALKTRIHKTISGNLSRRNLILGTAITGFFVTVLEAVCTGQVYLPTIILMTRAEGLKLTGWLYLLLYNFLFVLPLLIIMILAYFGLRWDDLSRTTQKNLPILKTVMGVVLVGLALFLVVAG